MFSACSHKEEAPPPPRPVLVEHPQPLAGENGEVFPGTVRAREEADLAFRVSGKIATRQADAGTRVKAGQVLATLDPEDLSLNVKASEANVQAAEADMHLAEANLKRNQDMLDKGFISKSVFDVAENQYKLAQARAEQARSSLAVVKNQSRYTSLVADKAGVITAQLGEVGQVVAAGQPVFRIATEGAMEVVIHVPEGRLESLNKAKDLVINLWAMPERLFKGRVAEVNPQADRSTRTHEVRVVMLDPDGDVKLGMTASVIMAQRMEGTAFVVPMSALAGSKEQAAVWIVGADSKAHAVPVQVLRYLETGAVVGGELKPDMNMVTAGIHLMVDGMAVTTLQRQRGS